MHVRPLGDRALIVDLGHGVDDPTRRRVHALWSLLHAEPIMGVRDIVPGLASVALHYDPALVTATRGELPHAALSRLVEDRIARLHIPDEVATRTVEIPVCYDPAVAPDLADVARHAGMTTDDVIAVHSGGDYVVHMVGFLPGFPYLAGLDPRLTTPRRAMPRVKVPAGSVGIGGSLTGIYPLESPGGWQIIGCTSAALFSVDRAEPTLLRIGDRVRLRATTLEVMRSGSSA
jgi:inhibitor of KinA